MTAKQLRKEAKKLWTKESRGHEVVHGYPGDPIQLAFKAWRNELSSLERELELPHAQNIFMRRRIERRMNELRTMIVLRSWAVGEEREAK